MWNILKPQFLLQDLGLQSIGNRSKKSRLFKSMIQNAQPFPDLWGLKASN